MPAGLLSDQSDRPGPLLRHVAATTIEVLTETDLCGLHAAWSLARLGGAPGLAGRCLEAADWHAAELQPDNATQTPWAIHVFIVHGVVSHSATMLAEAESRLHACIVSRGRPDRRSALILDHAASELSLLDAGAKNGRFWFQTV
ncbi:MAG: hypothetical protein IT438_02055 [Phycisphaerales bacterium]|nr:hypothetical protein [Phycisphaerales bacterium]